MLLPQKRLTFSNSVVYMQHKFRTFCTCSSDITRSNIFIYFATSSAAVQEIFTQMIYSQIKSLLSHVLPLLISSLFYIVENSLLTSLDVDQSTSNIYYTTQESVKVFSPKDSTKRSLIHLTGLSQPDHIKLHPNEGYVFRKSINH